MNLTGKVVYGSWGEVSDWGLFFAEHKAEANLSGEPRSLLADLFSELEACYGMCVVRLLVSEETAEAFGIGATWWGAEVCREASLAPGQVILLGEELGPEGSTGEVHAALCVELVLEGYKKTLTST